MLGVDEPNVAVVDTHTHLAHQVGGHAGSGAIYNLHNAILAKLHLPAQHAGAGDGVLCLLAELHAQHSVGGCAENLGMYIATVRGIAIAPHAYNLRIVGIGVGGAERRGVAGSGYLRLAQAQGAVGIDGEFSEILLAEGQRESDVLHGRPGRGARAYG